MVPIVEQVERQFVETTLIHVPVFDIPLQFRCTYTDLHAGYVAALMMQQLILHSSRPATQF